ncbi:hypothetical protein G7Y89_g9592 [Cudoniella acicularis]|uniref:DNA2/NAM7 helicase-like C-terminal domain-containing protein n=1 Tax=Cudoniella acicularis TaxID=354080 RepID=A0A8H4RFW6_9HELO|nr:hypothetical protein G7Y89_g9592 [Cudoniella acicularis]
MEPHMLSALLPSVEHFVAIGDHQQLRPQINNFKLSLESQHGSPYKLDRSQLERLSVGEKGRRSFPVAQLNVQRHMRPEISALIRSTLYPRLVDHETVQNLPDIDGHTEDLHNKSHSNKLEVEMTCPLVRHIIRQGAYNSSNIAVLTPYTSPLQLLRSKFRSEFEIVLSDRDQDTLAKDGFAAVNTPDGTAEGSEDSELVPLMKRPLEKKQMSDLLWSNEKKNPGFLKTSNRINVLLSRAQHGLIIIGETVAAIVKQNAIHLPCNHSCQKAACGEDCRQYTAPVWSEFLATGKSIRHNFSVPKTVRHPCHTGMFVLQLVDDVTRRTAKAKSSPSTRLAAKSVAVHLEPATTTVLDISTEIGLAGHVNQIARYVAPTLPANRVVQNHAPPVSSDALGLASIKASVPCRVLHHVTGYRATSAASRSSHAGIVLEFVEKCALRATVRSVPRSRNLVSTYLK